MARRQNRQREVLAGLIQQTPGLTHAQLRRAYQKAVGAAIPYNTLRARLDELITLGTIARSERAWNPTYTAVTIVPAAPAESAMPVPPEVVPLSDEARRTQALIRSSRGHRAPVGYRTEFLDAYEPGQTQYLAPEVIARLTDLGRTAYAGQPAGTYARDIMQRLTYDLSYGSSRLEGNRYSRIDTEELLRGGTPAPGTTDKDRQMILNHKSAIEFLVENATEIRFNRYTVSGLHALLAENLLEDREDEGRLRVRPIAIGNSVYTPTAIPQLIEERFDTLLRKAEGIPESIEQSFFMMVHLPYLQPFIDVNKRTSRLAANIPLIRANLCPLSFVDVPEGVYTEGTLAVYEQTDVALLREVFIWAYERSCAQFKVLRDAMGDPDPIRLNYRTELRALVADVVRGRSWPDEATLYNRAESYAVREQDRAAFAQSARKDLLSLRPEVLARFGLRMSEFESWRDAVAEYRSP